MAQTFLGQFIKNGLMDAARSGGMPGYRLVESAVGYHKKGVLTEDDLVEINAAQEEREAETQRKAAERKEQAEKLLAAETAARSVKALTVSAEEAPVMLMSVEDAGEQSPEARSAALHEPVRVPRRPPKDWRIFRVRGGAAWKRVFHRRRG